MRKGRSSGPARCPTPACSRVFVQPFPAARVLPIGTSARVGGTHDVEVEAMEGFGILRACELAGVPAVEVRVVSNEIDEPDRALWRFDDAFAALGEMLPRLVAVASSA